MLAHLRNALFTMRGGPLFAADDDKSEREFHLLLSAYLTWMVLQLTIAVPIFAARKLAVAAAFGILSASAAIALFLLRRGLRTAAAWSFFSVQWLAAMAFAAFSGGIHGQGNSATILAMCGAGWLLGRRVAALFAAATVTVSFGFALTEHLGHPLPVYFPGRPLALWFLELGLIVLAVGPVLSIVDDMRLHIAAVRRSQALLLTAQRVGGLGTYVLDIKNGVWSSSAVLDEILGIGPGFPRTVEGWGALIHPECRESMINYLRDGVIGSRGRFDREYRVVRHSDGSERWVHGHGELEYSPTGEPLRMVGTILDITERKHAEARLNQAQKMELIGRLAGSVAHDFNNLLTVINGYSHLLRDRLHDPEHRESLEEIHLAGQKGAALTRQLLAFSRQQPAVPRIIDLNATLRKVQHMLRRLAGETVELILETCPGEVPVAADPNQIEQIALNLVVNARDAMPKGGTVTLRTSTTDQPAPAAVLTVTDTGMGIELSARERIFEPFFTTKEIGKGTGLGLAIVKAIAEQNGGTVAVSSTPGHGTTFTVEMPRVSGGVSTDPPDPVTVHHGGHETVLVVEDQPAVRKFAADALRAYGYRVIEAAGAVEALHLCDKHGGGIDLVLTDVIMPKVSGKELARSLEGRVPTKRILFMSGFTPSGMIGDVEVAENYIQKPFTPAALAQKVRELLAAG